MRSVSILLLGLCLLSPLAAASLPTSASSAPAFVVAAVVDQDLAISWTPGAHPADAYNIYGLTNVGTMVLLDSTPSSSTADLVSLADPSYTMFAVTGVVNGQESNPTYAMAGCVVLILMPPPPEITVGDDCIPPILQGEIQVGDTSARNPSLPPRFAIGVDPILP